MKAGVSEEEDGTVAESSHVHATCNMSVNVDVGVGLVLCA